MRKILVLIGIIIVSVQNIYAATAVNTIIRGKVIHSVEPSIQENGVSLVPVDEIKERLNLQIKIYNDKVKIWKGKLILEFIVDKNEYYINGARKVITIGAKRINDTVFVPIKPICELYQITLQWDKESNTLLINSLKDDIQKLGVPMSKQEGINIARKLMASQCWNTLEVMDEEWNIYGESGENFFCCAMKDVDGAIYINIMNGEAFLTNSMGQLKLINIERTTLQMKMNKKAQSILKETISLINSFIGENGKKYFYYKSTTNPKCRVVVCEDNTVYDGVKYQLTGNLERVE